MAPRHSISGPRASGPLAAAALLLASSTAAAGTVSGTVYIDADRSGTFSPGDRTVEGAAVFFESSTAALSGPDGTFFLSAPDRDGLVWVRAPEGFAPGPVFAAVPGGLGSGIDLALRPVPERRAAFVHASDTHVGLDEHGVPRELSAADLAFAVEQAVDPGDPPMFVVVTGDMVNGASRREFAAIRELAEDLPVPLVPVPGNHDWYDGGANYREAFGPPTYSFDAGGTRFVVLNDNGRADVWRAFIALDARTGAAPERPIVAFMHRPPTDAQLDSLEAAGVGALFSGHWHSNMVIERGGLLEYNTEPLFRGGIDTTPAGYRVVELTADGLSVTHHALTSEPHAEILFPAGESCVGERAVVIASVELGPGPLEVTAETDGGSFPLARSGGWTWRGEVELGGAPGGRIRVRARRGGREVVGERTWRRCGARHTPEIEEWPQLGGAAHHRGYQDRAIAPPLVTLWARSAGGHVHGGSPVIADSRVFVSVSDFADASAGAVAAFDAATGAPLWRREVGVAVRNAPAVSRGILVFGRADGVVEAVAADSGAPLWQLDLGAGLEENQSILQSAPTISGGVVYIGVHRRFAALELETGALLWEADPATGNTLSTAAAAAVLDGLMVATVARGRDGAFAWNAASGGELWRTSRGLVEGMHASPVFGGGEVYLTNAAGKVSAVTAASGEVRWVTAVTEGAGSWDYAVVATPALAGGRLFVPTQYGALVALDTDDGRIDWSVMANDSLLFVTHGNTLSRAFPASPAVTRDILWIGGADGLLRAHEASSGDELWWNDLGSPITAGVAPAGEVLYVATFDGTLRAMAGPRPAPPELPGGCGCRAGGPGGGTLFALLFLAVLAIRAGRGGNPRDIDHGK